MDIDLITKFDKLLNVESLTIIVYSKKTGIVKFISPKSRKKWNINLSENSKLIDLLEITENNFCNLEGFTCTLNNSDNPISFLAINQKINETDNLLLLCDISDIKKREHELLESNRKFSAITNSAKDGVIYVDTEGIISFWNPGASQILGYTPERVVGRSIESIITDHNHAELMGNYTLNNSNLLNSVSNVLYQIDLIKENGEKIIAEISVAPVQEENGWSRVLIFRDITNRIEQEMEHIRFLDLSARKRNMENITQLVTGIAHDFNNLLAGIDGQIQYLNLKIDKDDPIKKSLYSIDENLKRAEDIIDNLMVVLGDYVPKIENHKLIDLLKQLKPNEGSGFTLKIDSTIEETKLSIDEKAFFRIMKELISNAENALHGCDDTEIIIWHNREKSTKRRVCIDVIDYGHGISRQNMYKVFQPYFTTDDFGNGSGLGMFMVYGLVKQNKGDIEIISEVGAGTTIRLMLPRGIEADNKAVK